MAKTDENENDFELIETIFYELDNSMFAVAVISGIAIGGFLIYLYMARQKNVDAVSAITNPAQFLNTVPEPEAEEEAEEETEDVSIPADFNWAPSYQNERGLRG